MQLLQCQDAAPPEAEEEEESNDDEVSDDNDDDDMHFLFHMNDNVTLSSAHMIDQNWILLDSKSAVNIFSNKKFLRNVRHRGTERGLRVHSNGGH
jgi:hypothetical protein